jgi:hypothetical protein
MRLDNVAVVENQGVSTGRRGIPGPVAERVRRPIPAESCVLPGSLPVVSFGDPNEAVVATLSLNPSWREFESPGGVWLDGPRRRLASLISVGVADPRELDDEQVATVVAECNGYFRGPNWYRGWFHWLESILNVSEAGSYFDGTACHLDLVQWATKPAQGELPPDVWERLVEQDRNFLRWQLANTNVRVLLLNGAAAILWLQEADLVHEVEADVLPYDTRNGRAKLRVYRADADGVAVLGWNRPLAGALSADGRLKLSVWLADALKVSRRSVGEFETETPAGEEARMFQGVELENGYVPEGTIAHGVHELERLLSHWLAESERPTVGDVGRFGGSPIIRVRLEVDEFVLNRDTKRAAIQTFLAAAAEAGGAERLRWHVTTNARGAANRVSYRSDDAPTPGWYAYVRGVAEPRSLG